MKNLSVLLCGKEIKPWEKSELLPDQLAGVSKVIVNYSLQNHDTVQAFVSDLKLLLKISVISPIKIEVFFDNEIMGARIKKDIKKLEKSMQLCWVTKAVVTDQIATMSRMQYIDSCLSDMSASLSKVVK